MQAESQTAQKKNIELAAEVDSAAGAVKKATDAIATTHASEVKSLHHKFEVKEKELLGKIGSFEKTIEALKSEHAGEVAKLTNQVEEVNIKHCCTESLLIPINLGCRSCQIESCSGERRSSEGARSTERGARQGCPGFGRSSRSGESGN